METPFFKGRSNLLLSLWLLLRRRSKRWWSRSVLTLNQRDMRGLWRPFPKGPPFVQTDLQDLNPILPRSPGQLHLPGHPLLPGTKIDLPKTITKPQPEVKAEVEEEVEEEASKNSDSLTELSQLQESPNYPSVGGRLGDFWQKWEALGADPWVVSVLREGYNLEFSSSPRLSNEPLFHLNSKHPQVALEIEAMIQKRALEPVVNPNTPGFYSRIFVVPKKTGGFRPVIDLKLLNQYLVKKPFKMETGQSIRRAMQKGMWVYSIDLKDAYFHIPIHPRSRKYLRITHQGQVYQFKALPFGVSSAPWLFTKIFSQLAVMLRSRKISIHLYLDDWLLKSLYKNQLLNQRSFTIRLIQTIGCLINWGKSELELTQEIEYVGLRYDLKEGMVYPALEKMDRLKVATAPFLEQSKVVAVKWQSLLGLLTSLQNMVPLGRLHVRQIQYNLHSCWSPQKESQETLVPVWDSALQNIFWWLDPSNFFKGVPLHHPEPQITVFTDASIEGWGAHSGDRKLYGKWTETDKKSHINVLEMRAVIKALEHLDLPLSSSILISSDNTTVIAYINNQGGTRSYSLMQETLQLYQLAQSKDWFLKARFLPGVRNVLADSLSRKDQILPAEWALHPAVVKAIFRTWETPLLDLFATYQNNQLLPVYVSPIPDQSAYAVDALSFSWENLQAYAYPPTSILTKVIEKVRAVNCRLILIAPAWPSQPWYTDLLDLSIEDPLRLPLMDKLLKQTGKNMFHSNPGRLNLHAWRLQNTISVNKVSQMRSPLESWNLNDLQQEGSIAIDGKSLLLGVKGEKRIHSRPLSL